MRAFDATAEGKNKLFENPDYFPMYSKSDRYFLESIHPSYK